MNARPAVLLFGSLFVLSGCPVPKQYGGEIPVDQAGFADRVRMLCRLEMSDDGLCAPDQENMKAGRREGVELSQFGGGGVGAQGSRPEREDREAPTPPTLEGSANAAHVGRER